MSEALALDVRNITKRFPGVLANDQVELRVQPTLYEQRGDYQLLVDAMRKAGQPS